MSLLLWGMEKRNVGIYSTTLIIEYLIGDILIRTLFYSEVSRPLIKKSIYII